MQQNKANALKPQNPGYQINQGVIDNAKTLSDQYGNYHLPGYSQMSDTINRNYADAFSRGSQGATSSADVLDLATKMAYGKNSGDNQLNVENAQGKQGLLGSYLDANEAAGREYQGANAYDRDMYQQQLKEKAALDQAGATNEFGAFDQIAGAASKGLNATLNGKDNDGTDGSGGGPNGSAVSPQQRGIYNKYFYPNGSPRFDANGNPISSDMWQGTPGSNKAYATN